MAIHISLVSGLEILSVDQNGIVHGNYHNESIELKPGDTWRSPVVSTR